MANEKIDSNTQAGKANSLVHYWLSHAMEHGVEDAIVTWAIDINKRGDVIKGDAIEYEVGGDGET